MYTTLRERTTIFVLASVVMLGAVLMMPAVSPAVPQALLGQATTARTEALAAQRDSFDLTRQHALLVERLSVARERLAEAEASIPGPAEIIDSAVEGDLPLVPGIAQSLEDASEDRQLRDSLAAECESLELQIMGLDAQRSLEASRVAILEERAAAYEAEVVEARQREAEEAARRAAEERNARIARYGVFPVAGATHYVNSWGFARSGGRRHKGSDLMAARGTPVLAIKSGTMRTSNNRLGGKCIYLTADDGTVYYYAHLNGYATGGGRVEAGQVIGYVGATGNAGSPHLHLEIKPGGGASVNPYPALTRMVRD